MTVDQVSHGDLRQDIGSVKADVANVKEDIREVRDDVKRLIAAEERRKGERGAIALLASVGGSIVTLLASKLFPKLLG